MSRKSIALHFGGPGDFDGEAVATFTLHDFVDPRVVRAGYHEDHGTSIKDRHCRRALDLARRAACSDLEAISKKEKQNK